MNSLVKRLLNTHRQQRRWLAAFLCLAILVSMGTVAAVSYTGVAMTYTERLLECPYTEAGAEPVAHVHNDDCRDEAGNLICALPELQPHEHSEACYEEHRSLICEMEESDGHVHSEDCREEHTGIICGLEENPGHLHDESCYTEETILVCENTDEDHEHTEACYVTERVLSCGIEEGEGAHTHTEDCFKTESSLICGMEEGEGAHHHTEDCYETERVLICGQEELPVHVHGEECFRVVERTVDGAENPESEAGEAAEEEKKDELPDQIIDEEELEPVEGDIPENGKDIQPGEEETETELTEEGAASPEEPKESNQVEKAEPVEGQAGKELTEEGEESSEKQPAEKRHFEGEADGILVVVEADPDAFPEGTTMEVAPVEEALEESVSEAVNAQVLEIQAVDIIFRDADGNEIEPAKPIRVTMTAAEGDHSEENAQVVHVDHDGKAEVVEQAEDAEPEEREVVFDADAFTIYAIVYTVDFEYEVDGQVYTAAITGADDMLLSEILKDLGGYYRIEEISSVEFSDPALVRVTGLEGDWSIRPLKEIGAGEYLKVTTKDNICFHVTIHTDGITEAAADIAVISAVNDLYLPEEATAFAKMLDEEAGADAIEAAQTLAPEEESAANTVYQVFDIGLNEVNPEDYEDGFQVLLTLPETVEGNDFHLYHIHDDVVEELVLDKDSEETEDGRELVTAVSFVTGSFSEFVLRYTVDFHYSVDGKTYELSIPGGGFVSFMKLAEALGLAEGLNPDEESVAQGEAEETAESISLDDITVSEETRQFVENVKSIIFSSPELVWVGCAAEETTVGTLKEANGLEIEYSAELTEEQINEINAQTVEAGDWALISLLPFDSEETLTITMKNGDEFTVKVTDAQKPYKDVESLETGTYIIYNSFDSGKQAVFMKNDGTSYFTNSTTGVALNAADLSNYTWNVTKNANGTFTIRSTRNNIYINLWGNNHNTKDEFAGTSSANLILETTSSGITISYGNKKLQRRTSGSNAGFYVHNSSYGLTPLTFFKIEDNPSGGASGESGIELTDEEREEMEKWKETLERFNTLTDYNKTAEVFDNNNRIYQIDITADSGITDFYKNVDLGLVLDVSNSMKFPSSLKALEDNNGNEQQVWMTADWLNWAEWAYQDYYNQDGCFYIVSDPALTSTIYKVFKDGGQWKYQDASENPGVKVFDINDGTVFKEPFRQAYTLYYADDKTKRMTYLQDSVVYAIDTLKRIVTPTEHLDDNTATVQVAYNFFAGISSSNGDSYAIRKSQDFVNLRSIGSELFTVSPAGNEASGTRQDLALYDTMNDPKLAANEFGWHSGYDKYVILVTDGAPNGATMNDVISAANRLKNEDKVKIITVGLSTKDVDGGSQMLKTIADDIDGDGIPEFYEAEKAKDLEYILLRILRSIMAEGLVRGTVTDTIDSGFYPVDVDGNPLTAGVYNADGKISGAQISDYVSGGKPTAAHAGEAFYTWEQVGDEWKITWYNQEIGWDDNDASTGTPWKGTVYVKAKEDYLGGNLIETNDGPAQIEPTGIKLVINGTPESDWRPLEEMPKIALPVPRVNVHELETKQNQTTFTVYKGTTVTPGEQLQALWNAIPIEEVVSATENGLHKITTGSSANVGTAGNGETFTLGSLMSAVAPDFSVDTLINQITDTNGSASASFEYKAYDHPSGTITITVERTVGSETPAAHKADTAGNPAEQYQVTFTYTPYTEAERMAGRVKNPSDPEHHNGQNGRGNPAGTMSSVNTHTIHVFQKGIRITKVDKSNTDQVLSGAVFELFRADEAGSADVSAYDLPSGNYTKVGGELTTGADGTISINPLIPDLDTTVENKTLYLPNIPVGTTTNTSHDTVFYLVEKTPPTKDGATYARMPGAIKLTMTLTEEKGTDPSAALYNWSQTAVINAAEYQNGLTEYLISDGVNGDIYLYKIKNGKPTDLTMIKVDKASGESIGGAKFSLMKGSENVDLTKLTITAITGGAEVTPEDYSFNGTTIHVITVPEGGVRIAGLADDTYTLREVAAPAGYIITDSGRSFQTENGTIKNADGTAHGNEEGNIAFKVENQAGVELPNTGGAGTALFTAVGGMMSGLAGAVLLMKKRRRAA